MIQTADKISPAQKSVDNEERQRIGIGSIEDKILDTTRATCFSGVTCTSLLSKRTTNYAKKRARTVFTFCAAALCSLVEKILILELFLEPKDLQNTTKSSKEDDQSCKPGIEH